MITFAVLWWVVGMVMVVRDLKKSQFKILASDLIPIAFLGFVGPIMFIVEVVVGKHE